jgi:AraC-like DNA-binding protein
MDFYNNSQFTYLDGFQINNDSLSQCKLRTLTSHQLYYLSEGEAQFIINDQEIILEKHCIYLIPAGSSISYLCKVNVQLFTCSFDAKLYQSLDLFDLIQAPEYISPKNHLLTEQLFKQLINNNVDDTFECSAITQLLLCPFLKDAQLKEGANALNRLIPVFEYIEENIKYSPRLEDLASIVDLDKNYFTSFFRKSTGISPSQYIQQRKIKTACFMLINHSTVSEITQELDFYDTSHFCRIFKKEMNETPRHFLTRIKDKNK